jgi:hypothetical protein
MAKTLQFRRGTTAELSSVTGAAGEIFYDTTKDTLVVMDGSLAGGYPLEKEGAGTGATGAAGAAGATGAAGANGATGSAGANGASGAAGVAGATGSAGANGATGLTGATGAGLTGATGIQGASGATGTAGTNGTNGSTGPQGASGPQGLQGASGSAGTNGSTGAMGASGSQGLTGASGPQSGYLNGPISGFSLLIGATGVLNSGATGQGWFGSALYVGSQGATGVAWGASGTIRATGDITAFYSSDRTLKENIQDIPGALDKVVSIGGKTFDWTDEYIADHGGADGYFVNKADFGVIAQDVQDVFPIAVRLRDNGKLAVDYDKLVALAFAAIKELKAQLDAK